MTWSFNWQGKAGDYDPDAVQIGSNMGEPEVEKARATARAATELTETFAPDVIVNVTAWGHVPQGGGFGSNSSLGVTDPADRNAQPIEEQLAAQQPQQVPTPENMQAPTPPTPQSPTPSAPATGTASTVDVVNPTPATPPPADAAPDLIPPTPAAPGSVPTPPTPEGTAQAATESQDAPSASVPADQPPPSAPVEPVEPVTLGDSGQPTPAEVVPPTPVAPDVPADANIVQPNPEPTPLPSPSPQPEPTPSDAASAADTAPGGTTGDQG